MKTFVVADWHIGDDRFDIMNRPFASREVALTTLVGNHNYCVAHDDLVIMVGDAVYDADLLHFVGNMNGRKILIRGNHDRKFTDEQLKPYFEQIIAEGDGLELESGGVKIWATHYPTSSRPDRFNIVGHIHSSWRVQLNMFNAGVDVNHFFPTPLDRVPRILNAITSFYDQDVWVGDHPANVPFKGIRGKPGSYLDKMPVPSDAKA